MRGNQRVIHAVGCRAPEVIPHVQCRIGIARPEHREHAGVGGARHRLGGLNGDDGNQVRIRDLGVGFGPAGQNGKRQNEQQTRFQIKTRRFHTQSFQL